MLKFGENCLVCRRIGCLSHYLFSSEGKLVLLQKSCQNLTETCVIGITTDSNL